MDTLGFSTIMWLCDKRSRETKALRRLNSNAASYHDLSATHGPPVIPLHAVALSFADRSAKGLLPASSDSHFTKEMPGMRPLGHPHSRIPKQREVIQKRRIVDIRKVVRSCGPLRKVIRMPLAFVRKAIRNATLLSPALRIRGKN